MSTHAYSEDQLVEQPVIQLLTESLLRQLSGNLKLDCAEEVAS